MKRISLSDLQAVMQYAKEKSEKAVGYSHKIQDFWDGVYQDANDEFITRLREIGYNEYEY